VNMANYEAEQAAKRQRGRHAQRREAGKVAGSHRPFGLTRDRLGIDSDEQAIIRRACEDLLAGKPVHQIKREWDAAGIMATTGKPWGRSSLRNMLMSPRMAGYIVRKPAGDPVPRHTWIALSEVTGQPIRAQHGPIVPEAMWEAVVAELDGRAEPQRVRPANVARYLLSGLVVCGRPGCGQPMRGMWVKAKGRHVYACAAGCTTVHGPLTDEHVTDLLLAHWARSPALDVEPERFPQADAVEALEARLAALTAKFAEDQLDVDGFATGRAAVLAKLEPLKRQQRAWERTQVTAKPMGTVDQWEAAELDGRRLMARRELVRVVVMPGQRGRRPFDPKRLRPQWRD